MKTDNWDDPALKDGDWIKSDPRYSPERTTYCAADREDGNGIWSCSRAVGHAGQHVATAGTDRSGRYEDVCVAWPGGVTDADRAVSDVGGLVYFAAYWRWCWDCGATIQSCQATVNDGRIKCCPDCRHRP